MDEHRHDHDHASDGVPNAMTVTDPVCGMQVNLATSRHRFEHAGTTFHFCSAGCERKFEADPDVYLAPQAPARGKDGRHLHLPDAPGNPAAADPGAARSAAWHSNRSQPLGRGRRAKPRAARHDAAVLDRPWLLALPVLFLDMGGHIPALGLHRTHLATRRRSGWSSCSSTPVVLWAGWPFFQRGWASVRQPQPQHVQLIALGTGAAYLYSLVAALRARPFPGEPSGAWTVPSRSTSRRRR